MMATWTRRRDWLRVAMAAASVGMLVVIGTELASSGAGIAASAMAELGPKSIGRETQLSFAMPPLSAFSETVDRPLFSRTRRPAAHAGALPASSSFKLVAIVISAQDRHALLGFGQPRKIMRVAEEEDIGGWTVEAILPDKIIVRHADAREEVSAKDHPRTAAAATTQ